MTKARDIASAAPAPSTVSATELGYLDGVSSAIQTQIDGKQAANANVSTTELGYLDGVTSAIQTQLDGKTAKNTLTTTGDIYYASSANTPARLGIGSTGNVLTVASGVPSWAAPAGGGGGLDLISTTSFSAVSSQSINDVFSSTYDNYVIKLNNCTSGGDLFVHLRLRVSSTDTTSNYRYQNLQMDSTTVAGSRSTSASSFLNIAYINAAFNNEATLEISNPYNTKVTTGFSHNVTGGGANIESNITGYGLNDTTSYTGFTLLTSVSNMTGSVSVYGYKK